MAEHLFAKRDLPLAGIHAGSGLARLVAAKPATRIVLRAGEEAIAGLSGMLELDLPAKMLSSSGGEGRYAFKLGPDEWLVIDEYEHDLAGLLGPAAGPYSAVDVSHRNVAIMVDGPGATAALNAGCPLDLRDESFPVGKVTRTVLGKAEIVLFRKSAQTYRVECWRSFAPYVGGLLNQGAGEALY